MKEKSKGKGMWI